MAASGFSSLAQSQTDFPLHVQTNDPTSGQAADGLAFCQCEDRFIVHGGWNADRIWSLDLPTAVWSEVVTRGAVPAARQHHAAAFYRGHLLVCGGELMVPPANGYSAVMGYFELSLETHEWSAIECFGALPQARSHHTTVVTGDTMVLFGGRPADGRTASAASMSEAKRLGFYDVFLLHILSRTWTRVEMYDPRAPMMWGHSAVLFRDSYVFFFGGFDVSAPDFVSTPFTSATGAGPDAPPVAHLSDVVHILRVDNWQWLRCTPREGEGAPVPRALHAAVLHGTTMIVFGGFTVDFAGRTVHTNDCWVWDVEHGDWARVEFAIPSWNSNRLLTCMYRDQFLVVPNLNSVFALDMCRRGTGWLRIATRRAARVVDFGGSVGSSPDVVEFTGLADAEQQAASGTGGGGGNAAGIRPPRGGSVGQGVTTPRRAGNAASSGGDRGQGCKPHNGSASSFSAVADRSEEVFSAEMELLRHEVEALRQELARQQQHGLLSPPQHHQQQRQPDIGSASELGAGRASQSTAAPHSPAESPRLVRWSDAARTATTAETDTGRSSPSSKSGAATARPAVQRGPPRRAIPWDEPPEAAAETRKRAAAAAAASPARDLAARRQAAADAAAFSLAGPRSTRAASPTTTASPEFSAAIATRLATGSDRGTRSFANTSDDDDDRPLGASAPRSLQTIADLAARRKKLAAQRQQQLKRLQERLTEIEDGPGTPAEKSALARAILEESRRQAAGGADASTSTQPRPAAEKSVVVSRQRVDDFATRSLSETVVDDARQQHPDGQGNDANGEKPAAAVAAAVTTAPRKPTPRRETQHDRLKAHRTAKAANTAAKGPAGAETERDERSTPEQPQSVLALPRHASGDSVHVFPAEAAPHYPVFAAVKETPTFGLVRRAAATVPGMAVGGRQQPAAATERTPSPVSEYWDDLQRALAQPPIFRTVPNDARL